MPPRAGKKLVQIQHLGKTFKVGDACLINPETVTALPFVGKIVSMEQIGSKVDDVSVSVLWYYRPEEALGGRKGFHGEKELFESDHSDEIHQGTIIGKCTVHSLKEYEALPEVTESDFYTRFLYRPGKKEFEPDQVPVYCNCEQPYNPDKPMILCDECDDWYHPACIQLDDSVVSKWERSFKCPACASKRPKIG